MGVFKLGKMTFGSLFKKPETVKYPFETKPQPVGLKGHICVDVESCILCGMCARSCPTNSITVDKPAAFWEINRYSCIQCGYCVTVCPKKCLSMEPGYAPAATMKTPDRFEVPMQGGASKATNPDAAQKTTDESAVSTTADNGEGASVDTVLESKIDLMDPGKAEKVRRALSSR